MTAAERQLAVRFPAAFVSRMLRSNGGTVNVAGEAWELHRFLDESDRERHARTAAHDLVKETRRCRELDWFPDDAVAVAECNGDRLIMRPREDDPEQLGDAVYRWTLRGGEIDRVCDDPLELWETPRMF